MDAVTTIELLTGSCFVALRGAFRARSHCRLQTGKPGEGDSNFAVSRRDFEQIVPKVTIDRFGSKPLLKERSCGLFPPL